MGCMMDTVEARAKAREILFDYPNGIRAGVLLKLVGEADYNAVLRELLALAKERRHGHCENCGHCDCE